jgi:hypothetical protein
MLAIFVALSGLAALLPGLMVSFALVRWFVPAWVAAREEALGGDETTHFRPRLVLSSGD